MQGFMRKKLMQVHGKIVVRSGGRASIKMGGEGGGPGGGGGQRLCKCGGPIIICFITKVLHNPK